MHALNCTVYIQDSGSRYHTIVLHTKAVGGPLVSVESFSIAPHKLMVHYLDMCMLVAQATGKSDHLSSCMKPVFLSHSLFASFKPSENLPAGGPACAAPISISPQTTRGRKRASHCVGEVYALTSPDKSLAIDLDRAFQVLNTL